MAGWFAVVVIAGAAACTGSATEAGDPVEVAGEALAGFIAEQENVQGYSVRPQRVEAWTGGAADEDRINYELHRGGGDAVHEPRNRATNGFGVPSEAFPLGPTMTHLETSVADCDEDRWRFQVEVLDSAAFFSQFTCGTAEGDPRVRVLLGEEELEPIGDPFSDAALSQLISEAAVLESAIHRIRFEAEDMVVEYGGDDRRSLQWYRGFDPLRVSVQSLPLPTRPAIAPEFLVPGAFVDAFHQALDEAGWGPAEVARLQVGGSDGGLEFRLIGQADEVTMIVVNP